MSAPETNVEKQTRRHKGPLVGIALAILAALIVLAGVSLFLADNDAPKEAARGAAATAVTM